MDFNERYEKKVAAYVGMVNGRQMFNVYLTQEELNELKARPINDLPYGFTWMTFFGYVVPCGLDTCPRLFVVTTTHPDVFGWTEEDANSPQATDTTLMCCEEADDCPQSEDCEFAAPHLPDARKHHCSDPCPEYPNGGQCIPYRVSISEFSLANSVAAREVMALWAHIVSEHACMMRPDIAPVDLVAYHNHEHDGPGTIRNHDPLSRSFSMKKIGEVLSGCDE